MADTNKETLVEKLTDIADGFRTSRSLTDQLTLDEMAELAAVPIGSTENKLPQFIEGTLTEITAEDLEGATTIREYAFYYYNALTAITLPNTLTSIEKYAFYQSGITSIVLPNSISQLKGDYIFGYCASLTSVVLPENSSLTFIPKYMFYYATHLDNVVIPNTFTQIEQRAFQGCGRMTNITLSNNLISISTYAFDECKALTNLTIPASMQTLYSKALRIGSSANKATITFLGTTPPSIQADTFDASKLNKIIVPAGSGEAYKTATNWANFADYIEEASV